MRYQRLCLPLLLVLSATPAFAENVTRTSFETAAREYRIHLYQTYRTQRPEYDQRFAEAERVARVWNKLQDETQKQELYDWFVAARSEGPPTLPEFVANDELVIRLKVTPTPQAIARKPKPAPSFRQRIDPLEPATPPRTEEKPGFFTALTRALVSKPSRDEDAIEESDATAPNPNSPPEAPWAPLELPSDQAEYADAEVSDPEAFENLFEAEASDQQAELEVELALFDTDREQVMGQLQDELSLDFDRLVQVIDQLRQLVERAESLEARVIEFSAVSSSELLEVPTLEGVLHVAIERCQTPSSWTSEELNDQQREQLHMLTGELQELLDLAS